MLSQVVRNAPGALTGIPKEYPEKGRRGTAGTKADFRSMSCWASSQTRTSRLSICALRGECA